MASKTEKTKTRKTPQQLAEERLGVAQRLVEKLETRRDKAKADYDTAVTDLEDATKRRDFLAMDPALPAPALEPVAVPDEIEVP